VAEVGMVVVVDDGDEENVTMPRCALGVSVGSGDSKVLLVCVLSNHIRRVSCHNRPPTGRYCSYAPHHKALIA